MFTEAVRGVLRPSYWRVVFALRSSLTLTALSILWFWYDIFRISRRFTFQALIFGVWVFALQQKFVGGNWKQAGRFVASSSVSILLGLLGFYIPYVKDTWYGGGLYLTFATVVVELLMMGQVLGLKKPNHIYMLVTVIDSVFLAETASHILTFWLVLAVAIPVCLVASSVVLWPRTANQRVLENAAHVVNELLLQFALVQRLAFADSAVKPQEEWMARHRHKVLARLSEMETLLRECVDSELWVGSPEPLQHLHSALARGWFVLTSMRALVLDKREWAHSASPLATMFQSADSSTFLELSSMIPDLLHPTDTYLSSTEIISVGASDKLRDAVLQAYADLQSGLGPRDPVEKCRYNAFLLSCLEFREYLANLRSCVDGVRRRHMAVAHTYRGVARNMAGRMGVMLKRAYVDTWPMVWTRLKERWHAKAWHSLVRNALAIGSSGCLSYWWFLQQPETRAFWIVVTVIVLTMDHLGQSFLKGILRILGVMFAWGWSFLTLTLSCCDFNVWLPMLFVWAFAMAYLQQDDFFGYVGASGLIAFYVVAVGMYGHVDWDAGMLARRALMVILGVGWSLLSFILVFPLDGMRDPRAKLQKAKRLCFEAYGEIVSAHGRENMDPETFKRVEANLLEATMAHHAFETSKFHVGILYHLAGVFAPTNRNTFGDLGNLSQRVLEAIVCTRLFLVMGTRPYDRATTKGAWNHIQPYLEAMVHEVSKCQMSNTNPSDPKIMSTDSINPQIAGDILGNNAADTSHDDPSPTVLAADILCEEFCQAAEKLENEGGPKRFSVNMARMEGFVYLCSRTAKRLSRILGTDTSTPARGGIHVDLQTLDSSNLLLGPGQGGVQIAVPLSSRFRGDDIGKIEMPVTFKA